MFPYRQLVLCEMITDLRELANVAALTGLTVKNRHQFG